MSDLRPSPDPDGQSGRPNATVHVQRRTSDAVHAFDVLPRRTVLEPGPVEERKVDLATVRMAGEDKAKFRILDAVDDIEYVLRFGTEDGLMIGTDYSHSDISANATALEEVSTWAAEGRISEKVARKILEENPAAFYGI